MIIIPSPWLLICIAIALILLSAWLMGRQSRFFFTKDPVRRKFSMLEMEFPARSFDLEALINGIYQLPDDKAKTVRALKAQLLLDYLLFIPAVYGAVFLLCMSMANSFVVPIGRYWFTGLAWAQVIPFVLDYIENTYFWKMISKGLLNIPKPDPFQPEQVSPSFKTMKYLEIFKWGIPLIAFACWASVEAYFWVSWNL